MVVPGRRAVTARTDGSGTDSGPDADFQATAIWAETDVLIDEARETVALIEKRDNLHGLMANNLPYNNQWRPVWRPTAKTWPSGPEAGWDGPKIWYREKKW